MSIPDYGWRIEWGNRVPAGADSELLALAASYAAGTMRALTLERVGGHPITVMPHSTTCANQRGVFNPHISHGVWLNTCQCSDTCGCEGSKYAVLSAPVGRIDSVIVDNVTLDPSDYQVESDRLLHRLDGESWPACASEDFTVTYLNAYPVDDLGAHAGGALALEFYKMLTEDEACRIPANVIALTRQGLTMQIRTGMFPGGTTGIAEVDTYVRMWNPNALRVRPQVYSPDLSNKRVTLP